LDKDSGNKNSSDEKSSGFFSKLKQKITIKKTKAKDSAYETAPITNSS
jgi:hypothetical protein